MKKPKVPKEDPSVGQLRDRQIEQLAKLDEEENERLKRAFVNVRGVRAFRRTGDGRVGTTSAGAPRGGGPQPGSGGAGGVGGASTTRRSGGRVFSR